MNTRNSAVVGAVVALGVIGGMLAPSAASAHGYVTSDTLVARVALTANADRGLIQYEPQSLEAPKGYPESGPADGQLASAGNRSAANLDEQSSERWVKNDVRTGAVKVDWKFTAPHKTSQWRYFMTRADWDPNDKLQRSDFELIGTVTHDGTPASTNPVHTITIPEDRTGYHVIYAVWDVADTSNAYYNVIDVNVTGHGSPNTPPTPTPAGTTPPSTPTEGSAPTAPEGLHTMSATGSDVHLMWGESAAAGARYEIFRDGISIATSDRAEYHDTQVAPSTAYTYTVRTVGTDGSLSPLTKPLNVTTDPAGEK